MQSYQGNSRNTYQIINQLLDKQFSDTDYFSSSTHDYKQACKFADYFDNKIRKISANNLANSSEQSAGNRINKCFNNFNVVSETSMVFDVEKLNTFEVLSLVDLKSVITSMQPKTCELDSLPTSILKSCLDVLLLPILHIINLSLLSGIFPTQFKHACIVPLLKNSSADRDVTQNYRPISNLSFLSKVIEKCV